MQERTKAVIVRLTPKEKSHLERQAARSGLKMEPFIRKLIMGMEINPRPPDEAARVIKAINSVGNNINQIARKVNITNTISYDELVHIRHLLEDLYSEIKR